MLTLAVVLLGIGVWGLAVLCCILLVGGTKR